MVSAMATREMDTPTYPIICRDSTTGAVKLEGAALSKMAKCVRWLHSHTVTELLERLSFLWHPLSDHCPLLRMEPSSRNSQNTHSAESTYYYKYNMIANSADKFEPYFPQSVLLLCALVCSESGCQWDTSQHHTAGQWTLYQIPTQCYKKNFWSTSKLLRWIGEFINLRVTNIPGCCFFKPLA